MRAPVSGDCPPSDGGVYCSALALGGGLVWLLSQAVSSADGCSWKRTTLPLRTDRAGAQTGFGRVPEPTAPGRRRPTRAGRGGVRLLDDDLHAHLRGMDRADDAEGALLREALRVGAAGLGGGVEVAFGRDVVRVTRAGPAPGDLVALLDGHLAGREEVVLDRDLLRGRERLGGEEAGDGQCSDGEENEQLSHQHGSFPGLTTGVDDLRRRILPLPPRTPVFRCRC